MPCSLVAVLATERMRQPSPARAVTRAAWTFASVCHSPAPSSAGAAAAGRAAGAAAAEGAAPAGNGVVRGSTSPATSNPSAARCRRAVWEMNSERGMPVATSKAWTAGNQVSLTLTACLRIASGATSTRRASTSSRVSSWR